MLMRFFRIPVDGPQNEAEGELNRFLSSHRIISADRQFVPDGPNSAWAICVTYLGKDESKPRKRGKVDYREVLKETDFAVYAKLRTKRKELAEEMGVPAYAIFTNEQLATFVRQRVVSAEAMRRVEGVGEARVKKYGDLFLGILKGEIAKVSENASAEGER